MTKRDQSKTLASFQELGDEPTLEELIKHFGRAMVETWVVRSYRKYRDGYIRRNSTHHPPTTERKLNKKLSELTSSESQNLYENILRKLTK